MTFTTVFEAGQQGYSNWWVPAIGIIFVTVGIWFELKPEVMLFFNGFGENGNRIFNRAVLAFATVWTFLAFFITFTEYWGAQHRLREGLFETVEGPVTNMTEHGRTESFTVNGRQFSYSYGDSTSGYHTTAGHGGVIRDDLYVRISYYQNKILRLEIGQ
jgi:hypothetical protein